MPDARPIHRVFVDGFWMDRVEVTQPSSSPQFVKATGYVTVAERTPTAEDFPEAPENLVAGSVVFSPPAQAVPLDNHYQWWSYVQGAELAASRGAESSILRREDYPVIHMAYEDAAGLCEMGRQAAAD